MSKLRLRRKWVRFILLVCFVATFAIGQEFVTDVVKDKVRGVMKDAVKEVVNRVFEEGSFVGQIITSNLINDGECEFACPNGIPTTFNPRYLPDYNGCGSYDYNFDFSILELSGFNDCCDEHDICYSTCNSLKKTCDVRFRKCLHQRCIQIQKTERISEPFFKICNETANIMSEIVLKLGCPAYGVAQKKACLCIWP